MTAYVIAGAPLWGTGERMLEKALLCNFQCLLLSLSSSQPILHLCGTVTSVGSALRFLVDVRSNYHSHVQLNR